MPSAPNTLSIFDNLEIANYTNWTSPKRVMDISKRRRFMGDIEALNINIPMASRAINNRVYTESYIGDGELVAEIQATQVVGGNLVVDFQPQNGNPVEFYRVGAVVFSTNQQIQGRVIAKSPGQVTVETSAGSTIAQLTASFTVGSNVQTLGNYFADRNSSGVEGLVRVPELQYNYLSLMRDGAQWNRIDMHEAQIVPAAGGFWSSVVIQDALDNMLKDIERSWMWGLPQAPVNDLSRNGGVDWAIRNRGGEVVQFASPPSRGVFMDWLRTIFYKRSGYVKLKKLYLGNRMFEHINDNFGTGFIKQIDPSAPRTGDINENANRWLVGGLEVDLVTNLSIFMEPDWNNTLTQGIGMSGMKKEWACYLIDQDPIRLKGVGTVPAIEKIHFDKSPFFIGRSTGIGDCPIGMPTADGQLGNPEAYMVSTSAVDRSELNFMYHGGVNKATGEYDGILEPSM